MPGTNLTRDEAAARAALLQVSAYDVHLDLTRGPDTFRSETTVRFDPASPQDARLDVAVRLASVDSDSR